MQVKYGKAILVLLVLLIIALGLFWVNHRFAEKGQPPSREELEASLLLDRPVDELPIIDDRGWNRLANAHPLLSIAMWWLIVQIIGLAAWPLSFFIFRPFRDRGYLLSKSVGLLLITYIVWITCSLRLGMNTPLTSLLALLILAVPSGIILVRKWGEVRTFLRRNLRLLMGQELLFTLAFLAFVGLRLVNPDLWHPKLGGEKPQEFAFLNATLKSAYFPPYDPWYAGGFINYYYYGYVLVDVPIKLTGLLPPTAFNLAVPLLFALTVGNSFSLAYNLTGRRRSGILAVLFIALLGNLDGMLQILQGVGAVFNNQPFPPFDFWRSSRVIPTTINEFPFFSFLFADLHPHMIDLPFMVLALALAARALVSEKKEWLWLAISPLLLGAIGVINTWDLPAFLGVFLLALVIKRWKTEGSPAISLSTFVLPISISVASILLYLPFFIHFKSIPTGHLETGLPFGPVTTPSPLEPFLTIWGLFLFISGSYLALRLISHREGHTLYRLRQRPKACGAALAISITFILALALWRGFVTPLVFLFAVASALLLFMEKDPENTFSLLLLLGAAVLLIIPEFIYLKDYRPPPIYRENSVFKFYIQAWILFGAATAISLPYAWASFTRSHKVWLKYTWTVMLILLFLSASIYPLLGTPARLGVRFPDHPPLGTLDGSLWMAYGSFVWPEGTPPIELVHEYRAIQWLLANVKGTPVILEAPLIVYDQGGLRVSTYTGLPTLVNQALNSQHYDWMLHQRDLDAQAIYYDPDVEKTLELLSKYDIRYIYLGQAERRLRWQPASKLERMRALGYLELVYRNEKVKIFKVATQELMGYDERVERVRSGYLSSIQSPLEAKLGQSTTLLGYNLPTSEIRTGETLYLTLWWRADREINEDYTVFVHLLGPDGQLRAQHDAWPVDGDYPTSLWTKGEIVEDEHYLHLSPDASPGQYYIEVGMYNSQTGERLHVYDAQGQPLSQDAVTLATIQVTP